MQPANPISSKIRTAVMHLSIYRSVSKIGGIVYLVVIGKLDSGYDTRLEHQTTDESLSCIPLGLGCRKAFLNDFTTGFFYGHVKDLHSATPFITWKAAASRSTA